MDSLLANRPLLLAIGSGIALLALLLGIYGWFSRRRLREARELRARLDGMGGANTADSVAIFRALEQSDSLLDRVLAGRTFTSVVETETARAGLAWTAGEFAGFVLLGIIVGVLSGFWLSFPVAVLVGVCGALAPFLWLARSRRERERKIEEQLPDAIDMLVNALKAGYSLQAGMNFVGSETPAPVGPEFQRFYDEQRLGVDVRQALQNLQVRLGTLDARMLVLAMIVQRETGGNLAEILDNIATVVRERIAFRGQVDVLTAEGKLSAVVLAVIPVLLFFVISVLNPEYIAQLTGTSFGQALLIYGAVSLVIGFVILQRMADIEV
jgi:tight adherence protein B